MNTWRIAAGLVLGPLAAAAARRAGALRQSGAYAAAVTGALILAFGGWLWAAGLLAFFISSSLLSRLFASRKLEASEKFAKGAQRDWGQVAANGGLAAVLAVIHSLRPADSWPWFAFLGALAAANADTWATEIGVLNRRPPRLISTWQVVETGASGGISGLGILASIAGAAFIGVISLFSPEGVGIFAAALGGLAGSLIDSWLGATWQAIYTCTEEGVETEQHPYHRCGAATAHARGLRWLGNDLVNFAASLTGAAVALGAWRLLA